MSKGLKMKEPDCDSRVIGSTVKIEIVKKVLKKFLKEGETSQSLAVARALEDSVRDIHLTPEEMFEVAKEAANNRAKRMEKREAKK